MTERISQAMVLAAGLGTRMGTLTRDRPKPLVEVAGRALIDRVIDRLVQAGVTRIVVNLHYKADQLQSHLQQRRDAEILFSDERARLLDTGGGILKALPLFEGQPFFVHNSDSIWHEREVHNLSRLTEVWDPARMDSLLLLSPRKQALGYDGTGDFVCDPQGRLTRRGKQSHAPYVWAGVQIISPELLTSYHSEVFSANILLDRAIDRHRLYGLPLQGIWMHVGSPEGVHAAENLIEKEKDT